MTESEASPAPVIFVLAGPNGAGKSSVAGDAFRGAGEKHFNPDEFARRLREIDPTLTATEADSRAWAVGRDFLRDAIRNGTPYAFETTLGGQTITSMLREAAEGGICVRIFYVALSSAESHIQRVAMRVAAGGHHVNDDNVRRRYDSSRSNMADLVSVVDEVRVFDNSLDSTDGAPPMVQSVIHVRGGVVVEMMDLNDVPSWAQPIVAAAMRGRGGAR